jgi:hypothetical protein
MTNPRNRGGNVRTVERERREAEEAVPETVPQAEFQAPAAVTDTSDDPFASAGELEAVVQSYRPSVKAWEDHSPTVRGWIESAYKEDAKKAPWYRVKMPNDVLLKAAISELRSAAISHDPRYTVRLKSGKGSEGIPANTLVFKVYKYDRVNGDGSDDNG